MRVGREVTECIALIPLWGSRDCDDHILAVGLALRQECTCVFPGGELSDDVVTLAELIQVEGFLLGHAYDSVGDGAYSTVRSA